MISGDMIQKLIEAGLTKVQASSATADTLINMLMPDDGKILLNEAKCQVDDMQNIVKGLRNEYRALEERVRSVSDAIKAISEAEGKYGEASDDKARNVIALYGAIITMNKRAGASPDASVNAASYVLYAYLGGQARRCIGNNPVGRLDDEENGRERR